MKRKIKRIINEFKLSIQGLNHVKIKKMLLFGSFSRNEATNDSDIDLLLVAEKNITNENIQKIRELANKLSLDYNIVISEFIFNEQDFENYNTPFLLRIKKEGIPV